MLKIGMPTLIELETIEDNIELCKELKLDFIEINMNQPQFQLVQLDTAKLKRLQAEHGIFFTFHLAEDIDIGHFTENIRNIFVSEIIQTLDMMDAIGAKILNMHMIPGVVFTLPNKKVFIYDQYKDTYFKNILTFSELVTSHIGNRSMKINLENTGIFDKGYLCEAVELLLENPHFNLTYDIGHDEKSGHKDQAFMKKNEKFINHYHMHDATLQADHLPFYDGNIDINNFLRRAESTQSTALFEIKTVAALKTSVERYRKNI